MDSRGIDVTNLSHHQLGQQYHQEIIENITMATEALGAAVTVAAQKSGALASKKLSTNIPTQGRKFNQLSRRGWSQNSVDDLVNNPHTTRESINKATGNKATAYFRKDGQYVVRDDVTGDIVQMSDTKLTVGTGQGQWRPDTFINDPYLP